MRDWVRRLLGYGEPMPQRFEELAAYNANLWHNGIHHPAPDEHMAALQQEFDAWSRAKILREHPDHRIVETAGGGLAVAHQPRRPGGTPMGIISRPPTVHECTPGWTWKTIQDNEGLHRSLGPDAKFGIPPNPHDYPTGTVWECNTCEQRWTSLGRDLRRRGGYTALMVVEWRREGWIARWWRLRKQSG